jgi:Tat protein secretion system quality control protein TatD with DNase activity
MTAEFLAGVMGVSFAEFAQQTTANARAMLGM